MVRRLWSKVKVLWHRQIVRRAKRFDGFVQTQNRRVIGYSVAVTAASTTVALLLHAIEKAIEIVAWLISLF